jgi:phosphomannomutase
MSRRGRGARRLHPTILREYDIRGIVGDTLADDDAYAIARAFATMVGERGGAKICIGYDGRLSSPGFEAACAAGVTDCGIEAVRIGLGPTPMLYYAVNVTGAGGGLMVSGSHNPPEYNGFKMMIGTAPFYGADIKRLGEIAAAGAYRSGKAASAERPVFDDYVARLVADFEPGRPLKVAWDAGNGVAGPAMTRLAASLPGEHILLNETVDGTFPAHHPDPTVPETLRQLQETVTREGCEIGIAFDGDGDRIGLVDGKGRILWGDQFMVLLAEDVLARNKGATIIADVKASQSLFDRIAQMGGKPLMWRTGHSLIKAKMAETGAPLAGEMSGHVFFADRYYGYDDALYAAVRLLNVLGRSDKTLAQHRDALPRLVNTPELRFACAEDRKFAVIDEVKARLAGGTARVNDTDGVRVATADGWWLLRASNTQDVLVARCEAKDDAALGRLKATLSRELRRSGIDPPAF